MYRKGNKNPKKRKRKKKGKKNLAIYIRNWYPL